MLYYGLPPNTARLGRSAYSGVLVKCSPQGFPLEFFFCQQYDFNPPNLTRSLPRRLSLLGRMTVFVKVLVSFILLSCFQLLRTRYRKGLHDIPGPFIASFTNLWKVMGVYDGNMPRQNVAVHEQYGSVVRIGPNHVSFASPQAFSIIHSSRQAYAKVAKQLLYGWLSMPNGR